MEQTPFVRYELWWVGAADARLSYAWSLEILQFMVVSTSVPGAQKPILTHGAACVHRSEFALRGAQVFHQNLASSAGVQSAPPRNGEVLMLETGRRAGPCQSNMGFQSRWLSCCDGEQRTKKWPSWNFLFFPRLRRTFEFRNVGNSKQRCLVTPTWNLQRLGKILHCLDMFH